MPSFDPNIKFWSRSQKQQMKRKICPIVWWREKPWMHQSSSTFWIIFKDSSVLHLKWSNLQFADKVEWTWESKHLWRTDKLQLLTSNFIPVITAVSRHWFGWKHNQNLSEQSDLATAKKHADCGSLHYWFCLDGVAEKPNYLPIWFK